MTMADNIVVKRHYVTFYYPGLVVAESSEAAREGAALVRVDYAVERHEVEFGEDSPAYQPDQAVVDAHDTVVTTGRPFAFTGDRRDSIVYLNNEWFLAGRHRGGTNPDDPRPLTVLRPSIVRHTSAADRDDANTRVQPFEDSTPLFSTHFALQRILHDLIANEAATVTIAGVDFFLGPEQYVDGYHEGSADRFANVPFNFSHDFTYAFWYTKRLRDHGLIAASGTLGALLDHSVEWYMNHLGRVFL